MKPVKKPTKQERYNEPYSFGFERFWKAYPERAGSRDKKEAWALFQIALDNGADLEAIIAGAGRYADQERELGNLNTKHVKMAKTWLNEHCWEDYAAAPVPISATRFFAAVGTKQWIAWQEHYQATRGRELRETDHRVDGRILRGWWFPSEYPPPAMAAAA